MKNKSQNQIKKLALVLIITSLFLLSATLVSAEDASKPVSGYVKLSNGDSAYNTTVIVRANVGKNNDLCGLYQSDPVNFAQYQKYCQGCNCSAPQTFTYSNGIYVENLGNLVHDTACSLTNDNQGDECGDDWNQRTENTVWAEVFGDTVNPPQGNSSTAPEQIISGGGTQWLENVTLPAGPDLPPEIVDISPDNWISQSPTTLFVETNELATCKYSTTSKSYAEKEYTFNGNTRYHNASVTLTTGTNNFYIQCQDQSSLLSNEVLHTLNYDNQIPVTADDFDNQWHNQDVTVSLNTDCGPSGCDWTRYCLGQCTPNQDYSAPITLTEYTQLNYRSKDIAGNLEDIKTTQINIDKEAPTTFDNYAGGTFDYDIYITLTSNCGISSCQWTRYCTGSSTCTPNIDYTGAIFFSESDYLRYHSRDFAGNTQSIQTVQVKIDKSAAPPSGGGGGSAERHYPGELVEELEEIPEPLPEPEPAPVIPKEEPAPSNITLPKEKVNLTPEEKPAPEEKISVWWYVAFIILIFIILIIFFIIWKRRKKKKQEEERLQPQPPSFK